MPKLLKVNDAAWLFAESHRTPMQIGMLVTLAMPENADEGYLVDLVERWRQVRSFQPPFNYLLHGMAPPRWKQLADGEIDLDYHFRHSAVPAPRGERELGVLVSRLHSQRLDRRYPMWECHVIEGVGARKWALYIKVHHSQIDGVGGLRLAKRMFSVDPASRDMVPPWAVGTVGPDQSGRPPREDVEPVAGLTATTDGGVLDSLAGSLGGGARVAGSVLGSLTRTYTETVLGVAEQRRAVPYRAPRSVFNGRIKAPRRFATQTYDIDRLRALARAADGSINDVFLAVCGGALRRYLLEHDALPRESLTANVPVSVREAGEPRVGNAITFLFAKLGTDIEDPVARVRAVRESVQLGKARLPQASTWVMEGYTTALMGPFLAQAVAGTGGVGPPAFNVVISNVPGFQEERYFDGSRLEAYHPLGPLFHGQALNITAVSNAGSFCIGYTGSRASIPSHQRIAVYSGEALAELEEAMGA